MNIQYYHKRTFTQHDDFPDIGGMNYDVVNPKGGETIALELPLAWVLETLTVGDFFTKQVGKARCSDDDNYNKKVGRELSTSRMKATFLTCIKNEVYTGDIRITVLQDREGNLYTLEKSPNYSKVHFTDYNG